MMAVYLVSGVRKGLGAAIFSTGGNLGFAIGPAVGSLLVLGLGLHATIGLAGPGLLLFLAILLYPGDYLRRDAPVEASSLGDPGDPPPSIPWVPLLAVCLIVALRSWIYMSFITYLPMFFEKQGVPLEAGSLMLTVFLAGGLRRGSTAGVCPIGSAGAA